MQIFKFDALIQRTNKQDINYKANINILFQKINVKQRFEYYTSALDEGIET